FASFRCVGECKTGVLLRAEKTPQGMKGVYLSLTEGDVAAYRVTLGANGEEISREKLRSGGGQLRIAPPPPPDGGRSGGRAAGGRGAGGRGGGAPGGKLPPTPP